jgi:hypothetical protein
MAELAAEARISLVAPAETGPELLLRELLAWVGEAPRTYAETIEAWRSNCPRHPVLDDAFTHGLIGVAEGLVVLTEMGREAGA